MSITQEKLLSELVDIVVKEGGSDLHLSEGHAPVIRVSNFLIPLVKIPAISESDMAGFLETFLSPEGKQEFERFTNIRSGVRDVDIRIDQQ